MTLSSYADPYVEMHSTNRIIKAAIRAFAKHFQTRDYTHCTQEDWLGFFRATPRASLATLRRYRSIILTFLQWIQDDGKVDVSVSMASLKALDPAAVVKEAQDSLLRGYFGSYDEMMDAAERVFHQSGGEPLYAPILYTMLTLVWYGVPWRSALDIRKDEVVLSDGLCVIQERYHIRHERAIRYIQSYLEAVLAYTTHDHNYPYLPSEWLFRSYLSEHVTEESLRNRLTQFNRLALESGVCFSWDKLRESSVFSKSYVLITNMGLKVTPDPHPALAAHLHKMFELTPSEINEDRYRADVWELFYHWCEKFRTVSPL